MQEFHFQNCLGGGSPKPPIAGGTSPPHIPPLPLQCSIKIVEGKHSHPPFSKPWLRA
ncbi:hypothetical protein DPMN_116763 [Dreissena polymorpha]|uniref:Uncharacterized protein n=1 Tax=Dreissena polymorpha TaxID=45954 RepID=A0A9D4KQF1_DREPO|nr:hypothetical protein DPMN_116763 [Dreissena polymorpha]